jgi:benzodiazapine receptor
MRDRNGADGPPFLVVFWRLDRVAGWCLAPLSVWVGFATVLNFPIWSLNA